MNTRTILIVEDDIELSALVAEILMDAGYKTDIVNDGALVYSQIVKSHPDLLMLDLHLPNVSGLEIVRQIRANPALSNIRILVATADVDSAKTIDSQVDVVFQKPYGINQMLEMINRLA